MNLIKILLIAMAILLLSGCGNKTPFVEKQPIQDAALIYVFVEDTISADDTMQNAIFRLRINNQNVKGRVFPGEYKVFDMKPATVLFSAVRTNVEQKNIKLKLEADKIYYVEIRTTEEDDSFTIKEISKTEAAEDLKNSKLAGSFEFDASHYIPEFAGSTAKDGKPLEVPAMTEAEIDALINKKLDARIKAANAVPVNKTETSKVVAPVVAPITSTAPTVLAPKTEVVKDSVIQEAKPVVPKISRIEQMDQLERAHSMMKKGILTQEEFNKMKTEILAK